MGDITPFHRSGGQYADFLVAERDTPQLHMLMARLGADRLARAQGSVFTIGFPERLAVGLKAFSGVGLAGGKTITGPRITDQDVSETGQWATVEAGADRVTVSTDFLGMVPVFTGAGFVSNRLHLIALALQAEGRPVFDMDAVAAGFVKDTSFNYQLATNATPVNGVQLVPSGATVVVDRTGTRVLPRSMVDEPVTVSEYRALVRRGAEEITANVAAILDSHDRITCGLTAGRDSRVIYAALLALGRVDEVALVTGERDNDVPIATGLVRKFGGRYAGHVPAHYAERTLTEAVERRRSMFFGLYHHVHPSTLSTVTPEYDAPVVRLTGAYGELYRAYWQKTHEPSDDRPFSSADVRSMVEAAHGWRGWFPESHLDRVLPLYQATYDSLPGRTLWQKTDSHYRNFRTRFHFGQSATLLQPSLLEWYPLASPSLLRASLAVPDAVRATGRVLFDVTRELSEELAHCQYGKDQRDYSQTPFHTPSRFDGTVIALTPAVELATPPRSPGPPRPEGERVAVSEFCWQRFQESFDTTRTGPFSEFATDGVHARVTWLRRRSPSSVQRWCSVYDALAGYGNLPESAP